jgi:Ca-activated chloride channel family protein
MDVFGSNFSWNEPRWLLLLLVLPVVYLLLLYAEKLRRNRFQIIVRSAGDEAVWQLDAWKFSLKLWLIVFSVAAFIVSLAGPRLGWRLNEVQQNAMDIVVAIDVSKSMLSRDLQPSRIERARRIVLDLLEAAPGDRVGLVLFAGAAYVQCPLTFDHEALRSFLVDLDPELVPVGGTNLSAALKESLKALGVNGQTNNYGLGELIVLLSDGENQTGDLDKAIAEVQRSQAKVIAVAMGTEAGGPIPNQAGGLLKDPDGNVVISKLDDKSLRTVAEKTGGYFVSGSVSEVSVAQIYQTFLRESGNVRNQKVIQEKEWFDRYQWFTATALLFLLVDLFWSDLRKSKAVMLSVLFCCVSWSSGVLASDRAAYNKAVEEYGRTAIDDSQKAFEALQDSSDKEVARRSLYNLGNLLAKQGRFEEAVKAYERALEMNMQDQQVRDNLGWAKNMQKSDQQKSDQQKSDQQKSDQQKPDQQKPDQQKPDQQKPDQQKPDQQKPDQQKPDQQKSDQQKSDQQKSDQQKSDQQKPDQQKPDQQKSDQKNAADPQKSEDFKDVDIIEAERLLRSVPEEPRRVSPIYRGGGSPQERSGRDW